MQDNSLSDLKISNGISVARIFAMFWIFTVNYFSTGIFRNFYKVEYQYAVEKGENFINVMNSRPFILDKIFFAFSYAGWSGVISMFFISGFSLWFSIMRKKTFNAVEYAANRFKSIYPAYFLSVLLSVVVVALRPDVDVQTGDVAALIMVGARFVRNTMNFNDPFWFITALSICYLFFPLLPVTYSRFKFKGLLVFTVIMYIFFRIYSGPVWHSKFSDALYPLTPFWVYVCIGVVVCHIIFNYLIKNEKVMKLFCMVSIIAGSFLLYRYVYAEPARIDFAATWALSHPFEAGIVFAIVFFSVGYLLPVKFYKALRWLSRGTFAVFLYHYLIYPVIVPSIKPVFFGGHLSLMFIAVYACYLLMFSYLQMRFDQIVGRRVSSILSKSFNIK